MDANSVGVPTGGKRRGMRGAQRAPVNPQLFEDTSSQIPPQNYGPPTGYEQNVGYVPPPQQAAYPNTQMPYNTQAPPYTNQEYSGQPFPGSQMITDPVVANMAMQYGQNLADQGKDYVNKNIEKYVSASKLKYYFAVDTAYVGKKLGLLIFPYAHSDWSIKYNQDEPVAPRYEVNAPDLYIPVMAFVTYILLAGIALGTKDKFSPEQLGMTASTALVWMVIEILALLLSMYIMNVSTDLKYYDLLAYCGYKYVGMILVLMGGLLFHSIGYYLVLLYMSLSLAFFLMRALKLAIIPHADPESFARGNKRRVYMLMVVAVSQPIFMWWLTHHLIS